MKRLLPAMLLVLPLMAWGQWGEQRHTFSLAPIDLAAQSVQVSYDYLWDDRSAIEGTLIFQAFPNENRVSEGSLPNSGTMTDVYTYGLRASVRRYTCSVDSKRLCPFFALGIGYEMVTEKIDMFTGNDGWVIHRRPYTYVHHFFVPSISFGLRFTFPFGLMLETDIASIFVPFQVGRDDFSAFYAFFSTLYSSMGLRIGWSF